MGEQMNINNRDEWVNINCMSTEWMKKVLFAKY